MMVTRAIVQGSSRTYAITWPIDLRTRTRGRQQRLRHLKALQQDEDNSEEKADRGEQRDVPPPQSPETPPLAERDEPASPKLQLPQSIISRLKEAVFSFDTLFVTSVENYGENGVLFKGNLRGNPSTTRARLAARLEAELGNDYRLFLLEDQEDKPVVVIIPTEASEVLVSPIAETALAVTLGGMTIATTLNIMGAELFNAAFLTGKLDSDLISAAVPGTMAFLTILAAHEVGHAVGAKRGGVEIAPPILIPAGLGLLGSFGAITRIRSVVPNRQSLATVTAPGPLFGAAASFIVLLVGLGLTAAGIGGVEVDSESFKESFLVGGLGRIAFGDRLFSAAALNCNPLFVAGWAGLIVNAINSIPAGELDGGKLLLALFGRRSASRMSAISLFLLGVLGFSSSLSLFWLLLVLSLQRGPIVPCEEELSPIEPGPLKWASIAVLFLPLVVLAPYPGSISLWDGGSGLSPF